MDIDDLLRSARRQALITVAGSGARLSLYGTAWPGPGAATSSPALVILLGNPIGVVSSQGIALADTDYGQAQMSTDVIWARLSRADGQRIGDLVAGIATDDPVPELILPERRILAGAFYRISGSSIVCD